MTFKSVSRSLFQRVCSTIGDLMFGFLKKLFAPKAVPALAPVPVAAALPPTDKFVDHDDDLLINAYCSLRLLPALDFPHLIRGKRDAGSPALHEHLRGFSGWVKSMAGGEMTKARYDVLRHIQKIQHHVSLSVHPSDLDRFNAWARDANAIAFMANGFICDPAGAVLLSPDGADDNPAAAVPYPPSAHDRKTRTEDLLANRKLKVAGTLAPSIADTEVVLRPAAAVAERLMALFAVAVRAESVAAKSPMASDEIMHRLALPETALSPAERRFLADRLPTASDTAKFAWCYECVYALAWAVGVIDKLPFPSAICDVDLIAQKLLKLGTGGVRANASLRPVADILDCVDLHQRLHWIARQAQIDKQEAPGGLVSGVILERHRALNWLVQFGSSDWDEVDTPT